MSIIYHWFHRQSKFDKSKGRCYSIFMQIHRAGKNPWSLMYRNIFDVKYRLSILNINNFSLLNISNIFYQVTDAYI